MAIVGVTLGKASKNNAVVLTSAPRVSEKLTSSAASAASTNIAQAFEYWHIATVGDIWVTFGPNPTAAVGTGFLINAGSSMDFEATAGDKVAVIDNS